LSYASRWGHALIDRRLYLPESWAADQARRAKAAVQAEVSFQTKPEIARELIAAALDTGIPCGFVLGDALYGSDRRLRRMLQGRQQPYVLAVRNNETLRVGGASLELTTVANLADALQSQDWHCHAAGEGTKGPRQFEWARISLLWPADPAWQHWLLIRRNRGVRGADWAAKSLVFAMRRDGSSTSY
jgi:hypothetical protein